MRSLLFVALAIGSASSLSLFDRLQGYASNKHNATTAAPGAGNQQNSFLSHLQNSSFGTFVSNGVDAYNQAKDDWRNSTNNAVQNNNFLGQVANSSFGQTIQNGINTWNNYTSGGSVPNGGDSLLTKFVPFLANVSTEALSDFYLILPNVGNMTIAQFEEAVNVWAAKYGYTDKVNAFNESTKNVTKNAEEEATRVVSSLPNVLENLKAISSNKNQTFGQMYNASFTYLMSLDEKTRQIVMILFYDLVPPQMRGVAGCGNSGIYINDGMIQQAGNFINGFVGAGNASLAGVGEFFEQAGGFFNGLAGNASSAGYGNNTFFNQVQSFFGVGPSGNGNQNETNTPLHANFPIFQNFLQRNNVTQDDVQGIFAGPRIGVVGHAEVQQDGGVATLQLVPNVANVQHDVPRGNKLHNGRNQNKNKKKTTTTAAPDAVAAGL